MHEHIGNNNKQKFLFVNLCFNSWSGDYHFYKSCSECTHIHFAFFIFPRVNNPPNMYD